MSRRSDDSLKDLTDGLQQLEAMLRGVSPGLFSERDRQRAAIANSLGGQLKEAVRINNTERLAEIFAANPTENFNNVGIPDYEGSPESNVLMYATSLRRDLAPLSLIEFLLKSGKFDLDHKCMKVDPGFVEGNLMSFRDVVSMHEVMFSTMPGQMSESDKREALEFIQLGKEALKLVDQPQPTPCKPGASC